MKYLIESKKEEGAPDPIDTFFSLMATTVKKFSPADQHFIKTKVFSLVSDIEGKYIHQNTDLYAPLEHVICPQPSASPALSQYSTSSSRSIQPVPQFPQATHCHGMPSPSQPAGTSQSACTSQWLNQQDFSTFPSQLIHKQCDSNKSNE